MTTHPITSAFAHAAGRLGLSFESTHYVRLAGGAVIKSLGLVRNFGSSIGTLLFCEEQFPSDLEQAELEREGYRCSVLFESYEVFDEGHFKDTLNDWGFYGSENERPAWYTGKAWSW